MLNAEQHPAEQVLSHLQGNQEKHLWCLVWMDYTAQVHGDSNQTGFWLRCKRQLENLVKNTAMLVIPTCNDRNAIRARTTINLPSAIWHSPTEHVAAAIQRGHSSSLPGSQSPKESIRRKWTISS